MSLICNFIFGILGILALLILFKFWAVLLLLLLAASACCKIMDKITGNNPVSLYKKTEFIAKPGVVYKECHFCNTKNERSSNTCGNCGKSFELVTY